MSRYHYHSGNAADLKGLVGAGRIAFEFEVAHGNGKRRLAVAVQPELILRLADAIRACGGKAGDEIGHVVWHLQHDRPIPCSTCPPRPSAEPGARPDAQREAAAIMASGDPGAHHVLSDGPPGMQRRPEPGYVEDSDDETP